MPNLSELEKYLLTPEHASVDVDDLRYMAKKAAKRLASDGTPLRDSVKELTKEASLNDHQLERLVEMTNTEAFLELFDGKSYDKNVDFPGGVVSLSDLKSPPSMKKAASAIKRPDTVKHHVETKLTLEDVFGVDPSMEKAASEGIPSFDEGAFLDACYEIKNAGVDLSTIAGCASGELNKLAELAKQASNEGAADNDIVDLMREAMLPDAIIQSMVGGELHEKTASTRIANTEHPIYGAAVNTKLAFDMLIAQKAYLTNFMETYNGPSANIVESMVKEALNGIE